MKSFSVLIVREADPKDQTSGTHGQDFDHKKDAIAYAESEMAKGYERAVIHQWAGAKGSKYLEPRTVKKYVRA